MNTIVIESQKINTGKKQYTSNDELFINWNKVGIIRETALFTKSDYKLLSPINGKIITGIGQKAIQFNEHEYLSWKAIENVAKDVFNNQNDYEQEYKHYDEIRTIVIWFLSQKGMQYPLKKAGITDILEKRELEEAKEGTVPEMSDKEKDELILTLQHKLRKQKEKIKEQEMEIQQLKCSVESYEDFTDNVYTLTKGDADQCWAW